MLEIKNANKYFNKGKKNEVHVINNTSITFNDNGLVAILGPSGCGKTTLLNTLGGLDYLKSGKIYIDGVELKSNNIRKIDKTRNINIGYIFQDYKLIENKTVFENVSIALNLLGITDKKEIEERVTKVLETLGILKYKRRPVSMLSGGERQRVGIARCLVKDPKIVLADEPTGNLDSKNSLEVMKIIKSISKKKLVILVTHEEKLAKFYADRIIEVKDGKIIKEYLNDSKNDLDYKVDNIFYLKDFNNYAKAEYNQYKLNIYSNNNEDVNLDIVVNNGNIYIRTNTKDNIITVDNNNIEFIDDNYKTTKIIEESDIKIEPINNKKYSKIFNLTSLIKNSFITIHNYSNLKKFLLVGFLLSGMFFTYAISNLTLTLNIKDENFLKYNPNYITVTKKHITIEEYNKIMSLSDIRYIIPGDSTIAFKIPYEDYFETFNTQDTLKGSLSSLNMLEKEDVIYGHTPNDYYEIVIDKIIIDNIQKESDNAKMIGLNNYNDFIGRKIIIDNMNEFTISGIVDLKSPSIYASESMFINMIANTSSIEFDNEEMILDYTLKGKEINLVKGRMPINDYEVIVDSKNAEEMPLEKEINTKIATKKLKVVGYYNTDNKEDLYLVNNNTVKYSLITSKNNLTIFSNDMDKTLKELKDNKINAKSSYLKSRNDYLINLKEIINNTILISILISLISLIEIYLMIRSSFLSKIKEIGIYRAIGVKKTDIYKMFTSEIIAVTTIGSIPGVILMTYILYNLSKLNNYFYIDLNTIILTIVFIYLFNIIIGIIPVAKTLKKSPRDILSRTDVN